VRSADVRLRSAGLALACAVATACSSTSTSVTAPSVNKCAISASSSPSSFGPAGGSGTISIQTARDCTWSVSASASWLSLAGASAGQGEAAIPYTVSANNAPAPRSASVTVGTEQIAVSQAPAACTFKLSSTGDTIGVAGGRLTVSVSTLSGCVWTAASAASWIAVTSGGSESGSAAVALVVGSNDGAPRVGTVNIAAQTYTVAQDGSTPAPSPNPPPSPAPNPPPPSPTPSPEVTVAGLVLTVTGRCPDLTFTILGNTITTSGNTTFSGGKCGNVKTGRSVTVQGTRGSNGVIAADVVKFN